MIRAKSGARPPLAIDPVARVCGEDRGPASTGTRARGIVAAMRRSVLLVAMLAWANVGCTNSTAASTSPVPLAIAAVEPATEVALTRLREDVWLHTSTRELDGVGRFPSHGLLIARPEGLLLIDTAWGADATTRLLAQIEAELGRRPDAAIITDFHDDRAGGIAVLEAAGVEVHSSAGIADRLAAAGEPVPARTLALPFAGALAGTEVEVAFPGAGHSPENLVVWLPMYELLFGGCLLRPLASRSLGNTADARLQTWAASVRAVRDRYLDARVVVPSHGDPGNRRLFDHSVALVDIATLTPDSPTKIAITVDDLPAHGPLPPGITRAQVHAQLLATFERHGVPEVRGFVIGEHATDSDDHREALRLWTAAGHPLGNHTWSHPNMEVIGVDAYLDDIDRNEAVLAELTGDTSGASWRSFRYPYLRQGFDAASSARVRAHLIERGYQIAEVSIDFWDWDYQAPYVRCLAAKADVAVDALRTTYRQRAVDLLEWHRAAAEQAFGRPIAHVLLLHAGVFTAEMSEELLTSYEARGVVWVSLDEALADPVYADVPLPPRTHGDVLVEQAITSLGVPHPPWTHHPGDLLGALCR